MKVLQMVLLKFIRWTRTDILQYEKEAPNTNRQFTSDYEYVGGAMSKEPSQTRYDHMYNTKFK